MNQYDSFHETRAQSQNDLPELQLNLQLDIPIYVETHDSCRYTLVGHVWACLLIQSYTGSTKIPTNWNIPMTQPGAGVRLIS